MVKVFRSGARALVVSLITLAVVLQQCMYVSAAPKHHLDLALVEEAPVESDAFEVVDYSTAIDARLASGIFGAASVVPSTMHRRKVWSLTVFDANALENVPAEVAARVREATEATRSRLTTI